LYGVYALKAVAFHDICGLRGCEGAKEYWLYEAYGPKDSNSRKLKYGYHEAIDGSDNRVGIGWYVLSEIAKKTAPEVQLETAKTVSGDVIQYDPEVQEKPKRRGRPKKASA
jgi:hypothetical protein